MREKRFLPQQTGCHPTLHFLNRDKKEHRLTPKETVKRLKVNLQWYRLEIERKVSDNDVILLLID